ncbi:hypothetical protein D9619_009842 [Psilocybe cf. subviscida]|uniref:DUF6535 domain-containing protein n=1 Tax=Psilocybe cf. subviscida TaxID=2480587 RepID=A0A8H5BLE3_9AGAR|nr:hypothetical protein D9619_009842 [Psilocybe cf. subviscida]
MPSERTMATVENASAVEPETTQAQGGAMGVDSVPWDTRPDVNLRDYGIDMLQEQKVADHDAMHSLPQGDARQNPQKSSNLPGDIPDPKPSDPKTMQAPKLDFDPFERLLKPLLEEDTAQCNAWKDEVQNILIFAGLFSAVVTAFIIESYQRLQPNSNDTIVDLLAHIAEKLDNPSISGTASVSSLVSNENFFPESSDININIFWFVSLILSLTAALIGIITLQWLREHQRYDNTLKAQQRMAIFNARVNSLQQWYVPQIFTGLPLLLQAALVLFFAGVIEFLFALRVEVAVPVTLSICIPLIFLITTTLLPILQLCTLPDPFRLSINDTVPSPCPYKSPQSLIFRRIGIRSKTAFKFLTAIVAGAYLCVVETLCFVWKLAGYQPPIFRSRKTHLQANQQDRYRQEIHAICETPGAEWTSVDLTWLSSRTIHAMTLQQATLHYKNNLLTPWTINNMKPFPPEVYDCTRVLRRILDKDQTRADHYAIYHCVEALFSGVVDKIQERPQFPALPPNIPELELAAANFCFALGQLLTDVYECQYLVLQPLVMATFIKDALLHEFPAASQTTVETLCAAFMASPASDWSSFEPEIRTIAHNGATQLIMDRLSISPERLFTMEVPDIWFPWVLRKTAFEDVSLAPSDINHLLRAFLAQCSTMQPNSQLPLRPGLLHEAYGGVVGYMNLFVRYQAKDDVPDTLAQFIELCTLCTPSDLVLEKPFL